MGVAMGAATITAAKRDTNCRQPTQTLQELGFPGLGADTLSDGYRIFTIYAAQRETVRSRFLQVDATFHRT